MNEHFPDLSAAFSYCYAPAPSAGIRSLAAFRPLRTLRNAAMKWVESEHRLQFLSVVICAAFSLAPAIFVMLAMSALILIEMALRNDAFVNLSEFIGSERATSIRSLLFDVSTNCRSGLPTLLSLLLLVIGVSSIYLQTHRILNGVWLLLSGTQDRRPQPEHHARPAILPATPIIQALGLSFLSTLLIVIDAASRWLIISLPELGPPLDQAVYALRFPLISGFACVAFARLLKRLQAVGIRCHDVLVYGAVAIALFVTGGRLFEQYSMYTGMPEALISGGILAIVFAGLFYSLSGQQCTESVIATAYRSISNSKHGVVAR